MTLHLDVIGADLADAGYGQVLRVLVKLTAPDGRVHEECLHWRWNGTAPERIVAECNIPVNNHAD